MWMARAGPSTIIQLPEGTSTLPLDPAVVGGQLHAFAIRLPGKQLILSVVTAEARTRWLAALQAATCTLPAENAEPGAALGAALDKAEALTQSLVA